MLCDVCGEKIINPDRSWPRANTVPTDPVLIDGTEIKESHLGCYRLARGYAESQQRKGTLRVVK